MGSHVEEVTLLLTIPALLLSSPQFAAEEGDNSNGEEENDAAKHYSNDGWDRQFITSPPVSVPCGTVALRGRHDDGNHGFK